MVECSVNTCVFALPPAHAVLIVRTWVMQWPWINAGKPILNTEYFTARCMYCFQAEAMNTSTIKKVPDLTSCRVSQAAGVLVFVMCLAVFALLRHTNSLHALAPTRLDALECLEVFPSTSHWMQ